jgi:hypothetical protein
MEAKPTYWAQVVLRGARWYVGGFMKSLQRAGVTMILIIPSALIFAQQTQRLPVTVHLPTSVAIDVARLLARDLGYPIDKYPKRYFFDQVNGDDGKALVLGYANILFWGGGHPIDGFQINESTGQIVGTLSCEVFDFPNLKSFQHEQQALSGVRSKTTQELLDEGKIPCERLTLVNRPVVPNAKPASDRKK